ncbi:MAG: hypothetical protein P8Z00_10065 [Anaerolineales bacterium]
MFHALINRLSKNNILKTVNKKHLSNGLMKKLVQKSLIITFLILGIWTTLCAQNLSRIFQDSWILDGLWINICILIFIYLVIINFESDLKAVTFLTSVLAFFMIIIPTSKYYFTYGIAPDNAVHFSLIRSLSLTGEVDQNSIYKNTPGFHVLIAELDQLSGVPFEVWIKVVPPILASLIPIAFYITGKNFIIPPTLLKLTIILSGFSIPLLYSLNGTIFTSIFSLILLINLVLRGNNGSFAILSILIGAQIILWHPSTTILVSIVLLSTGFLSYLLSKKGIAINNFRPIYSMGILLITSAITYWMYDAHLIWDQFVKNISLVLKPDLSPALIPSRLFELSFADKILIASFYHARDSMLFILAFIGFIILFRKKQLDEYESILRYYGLTLVSWFLFLIFVFMVNFGGQGYYRFLIYVVLFSPLISGYGLWKLNQFIERHIKLSSSYIYIASLTIIIFISCVQIYPYQPGVPNLPSNNDLGVSESVPILYFHNVNTIYQYYMLKFATTELPLENQIIIDQVGFNQIKLFFGGIPANNFRFSKNQKLGPTFLALHWPAIAGGYIEQAEFRSTGALDKWRNESNLNTIYDNNGSFILFRPENSENPFYLERPR